ncbi:MAG: RNA polymerase sigma-70 factor [Cyclobacteriaceae bacterium]
MTASDQLLIKGLKAGDEQSFERLFDVYYELLISYASKYLSSPDERSEVIQRVFIRLFERRGSLEIQSLKAYLLKSTYHGCLEELRRRKHFLDTKETDQVDDTDYIEQAEREAEIWKAIDTLPKKCHQIFVMSRFDDLKNQQIADQLGISKRTVETQISIALKTLRKNLLSLFWIFS